ncbi:MAG: hypothetical protein GXY19_01060 [Phycisphaerae bacterium]|nr:hypothetical protein [Phycisphaerae bacterium]
MCERWIVLMGLAVLLTFDSGASAEFVGHWPFDGNLNDVAGTANGTFSGGQASYEKGRVRQAISFDGVDDYVDIPSPTNPSVYTIAAWIRPARTDAAAVITRTDASGPTTSWSHQLRINAAGQFHHYLWVGAERHVSGTTVIVPDTWYHVTIMAENDGPMRIFVNGIEEGTSISTAGTLWATGTRIFVGSNSGHSMGWFQGLVDDLQIYDEALAADQIRKVMRGDAAMSSDPYPEDGTADLPRDVVLRWSAGEFAATHDVYFGTVFDDVNDGSRANPMNVLVSQGQTAATYDPIGVLGFETTYYWRIDEVNAAPDNTIYKGEVWSFTTEPVAYPVGAIVATSNGISEPGVGPENTVNGSGLDAGDQHSTASDDMWLATPGADPLWIQYQFDRVYKLHQMLVWNYNVQFELLLGFGIKNVTVECSENGIDWTSLGDVDLARATAKATYEANTAVEFGGTPARFVRLNVNSGYGMMGQYGLSEVRFLFIPAQAREPQPTDGATGVAVDSSLSWRAGREAVSHEVYYGTDPNALSLVGTTGAAGYTPEALTLATTYYWRVNEVNEADAIPVWEGEVWSFTAQEFLVVEDFESYNDDVDAGTTIFDTWIDGWINNTGSTVGYLNAPFAERTIVHGGRQSMPLSYDNTNVSVSETEYALAQNWTTNGIQSLSLYFHGDPENGEARLYVEINNTRVVYDGDPADIARPAWQAWNIDLSAAASDLSDVTTLTIGLEGTGATGVVFIDDIRLYPWTPQYITAADPGDKGLVAYYAFEGNTHDGSANGLDGTFTDGTPEWTTGRHGQAILFSGTNGYVDLGNDEAMNLTEAMTVACWVRDDGFTLGWQAIFTRGLGWRLQRNGIQAGLEWTCPPSPYLFSSSTVDDGEWHHVAGTYDSQRQMLYIDGVLDVEQAVSGPIGATSYRVLIGSIDTLTERVWHGPIDEVRLYGRALSPSEILWLADQTAPRHKPF